MVCSVSTENKYDLQRLLVGRRRLKTDGWFLSYLLVIDWLEVDEVAVEDEVHVDPGDDQDLIARQCITGLTSRQNSG